MEEGGQKREKKKEKINQRFNQICLTFGNNEKIAKEKNIPTSVSTLSAFLLITKSVCVCFSSGETHRIKVHFVSRGNTEREREREREREDG